MEECELCGRQIRDVYVLDVENVELRTCASCAKGKKVIRTEMDRPMKRTVRQSSRPLSDEERPLREDYARAIKTKREVMRIPLKVLAERINEKEGYLSRIEEGKTEPNTTLIKKLEKELQIKLTEETVEEPPIHVSKKQGGATLGDFILK